MRKILLLTAPLPIVVVSMALANWARSIPEDSVAHRNRVRQVLSLGDAESRRDRINTSLADETTDSLSIECQDVAARLRGRVGDRAAVIVKAPFVLGGDLSVEELERWYRQTIKPATQAMSRVYFRNKPAAPMTVLLFSEERTYRQYSRLLFSQPNVSIYGYYKPSNRTLVINVSTGGGTLVHELTHALIDFDFPDIPLWFNEGLASLHEECQYVPTDEGSVIQGLSNWRLPMLKEAIREGRLGSLKQLLESQRFRDNEAINYAHARYFCMYLQQQGILAEYYTALRENQPDDTDGSRTLREFFPDSSWQQLDAIYNRWVLDLKR